MKTKTLIAIGLFAGAGILAQAQTKFIWDAGGADDLWSNTANWDTNAVPDSNAVYVQYNPSSGGIDVDGDYTVNYFIKAFSHSGSAVTVGGATGSLTIDVNSGTAAADGIINASGATGGTDPDDGTRLVFDGNVNIANSGSGHTRIRNNNSPLNVVEFGNNSTLTLNSQLRIDDPDGQVEFNGTLLGSANLNIWADNVSFGAGHDSSGYSGNMIITGNGKLAVDGGTVGGGNNLQFNGAGELEFNAANAINGMNVNVATSSSDLLIDVNASQDDMGWLDLNSGTLTIDTAGGSLAFDDSSGRDWSTGSLVISNFTVGALSFGTDDTGLSVPQLSQITAYDSGGGLVSGLSLDSGGALIPEPATIGLIAIFGGGMLAARRMMM